MANDVQVNMRFNADTSQAKAQLQQLQQQLASLGTINMTKTNFTLTDNLIEAQAAARTLSSILNKAFNTNTSSLDLSVFNAELKNSGLSLTDYKNKLSLLGSEGQTAFLRLAQSISQTEAPLKRTNTILQDFGKTLMNTVKWQLSSSMIHGFMRALQKAKGYAEDLNESLNNIRIVSGKSADDMGRFAEKANKAAKSLSASTLDYTNASLIYAQQGLDDQQIEERTEITLKMAHAAGQSAEIISDQLTAVWNNYAKGSEDLEHFADAMVKLGADTASSSDEIAEGLEKFAAIGDTVGLSFDNAAAALATVTATTRQSADVVGTAFKTLFARIQDLELGETLEDGTDLGQYSQALEVVGINIKQSNGELKAMDDILYEMGTKWNTISKDQQVALAQTVAGVRQYTQLMALMNNFDFYLENVDRAQNSEGTLQEQADIWAESWEASSKRVKNALENIYQSLINENFFIGLNNTVSGGLGFVSKFIDALGGLKGVLSALSFVLLKSFGSGLSAGINNTLENFKIFSGVATKEMHLVQDEAHKLAMSLTSDLGKSFEISGLQESLENNYILQEKFRNSNKKMSVEQEAVVKNAMKIAQEYNNIAVEAGKAADKAQLLYQKQQKKRSDTVGEAMTYTNREEMMFGDLAFNGREFGKAARQAQSNITSAAVLFDSSDTAEVEAYREALNTVMEAEENYQAVIQSSTASQEDREQVQNSYRNALDELGTIVENNISHFTEYQNAIQGIAQEYAQEQNNLLKLIEAIEEKDKVEGQDIHNMKLVIKETKDYAKIFPQLEQAEKEYTEATRKASGDEQKQQQIKKQFIQTLKTLISTENEYTNVIVKATLKQLGFNSEGEVTNKILKAEAEDALKAVAAILNFGTAVETAGDKTSNAGKKLEETGLFYKSIGTAATGAMHGMSSFAMGLSSLLSIYDTLQDSDASFMDKFLSVAMSLGMAVPMVTSGIKDLGNAFQFMTSKTNEGLLAQIGLLTGMKEENLQIIESVTLKNGDILTTEESTAVDLKKAAAEEGSTAVTKLNTAEIWKNIVAQIMQNKMKLLAVVAILAVAAATVAIVKAVQAENEALIKNAEIARENNEETQKQVENAQKLGSEVEKLAETYEKNKAAGEDVTETYDELTDKLQETYKAYKELNITDSTLNLLSQAQALGLATGNWDAYAEAIKQANKKAEKQKNKSSYDTVFKEATGAGANFAKGQGHWGSNQTVERHVGDVNVKADKKVADIIGQDKYSAIFTPDKAGDDDGTLKLNTKNPAKFLEQYKLLGEMLAELEKAGKTTSDTYKELKTEYDAMAENAASIGENIEAAKDYVAALALEEKNIDPSEITNTDSYLSTVKILKEELYGLYGDYGKAEEAAKQFLLGFENIAPIQNQIDFLDKYERKVRDAKTETEETNTVSSPTWDSKGNIVAGTENDTTEITQTKLVPTYSEEEVQQKMADLKSYIESLSEDEKNTLPLIDLSKVDVTNEEDLKNKIAEKLSDAVESGLKSKLSTAATEFDFEADELEGLGDAFLEMARNGEKGYEGLDKSSELAKDAVVQYARLNRGVLDLSENYEDYADVLSDVKKSSNAVDKALVMNSESGKKLKSSLADVLNTSEDLIDADLLDAINPNDFKQAAQGNVQAIQNIRNAFIDLQAQENGITEGVDDFKNAMAGLADGAVIDLDTMPFLQNLIAAKVAAGAGAAEIKELLSGLGIDADISDFVGTAEEAAQIAADTGSAIVQNMSTEATIKPAEAEQNTEGIQAAYAESFSPVEQKATSTVLETMEDGSTQAKEINTKVIGYKKDVTVTPVPLESTTKTTGAGIEVQNAAGEKPSFSGVKIDNLRKSKTKSVAPTTVRQAKVNTNGSGSGGSKGKTTQAKAPVKAKKKEDEIERYHEINEVIEDQEKIIDRLNKKKDDLYGADRLKAMDEEIAANKTLIKQNQQLLDEAKQNLALDKQNAEKYGITFDEQGRINNYDEIIQQKMDEWQVKKQAAEDALTDYDTQKNNDENYDVDGSIKLDLDEKSEAVDEEYEDFKDAISQYEETYDLVQDTQDAIDDKIREIQQLNYEKLEYKLEIRVELNERDLADIEHQLSRLSENDYTKSAERIALIQNNAQTYRLMADDQQRFIEELKAQYAVGDINKEQFIEGMKEAKDAILEAETQIREGIISVGDELRNAFSNTADELDKVYERMQRRLDFADFYKDISTIINGKPDYQFLNSMLDSQTSMLNTRIDGRTNEKDALIRKQKELYSDMSNATSEEEKAQIRETLDQVESRIADLNSDIQSDIQTLAEYAQTEFENAIEEIADTWQEQNFGESLSAVLEDIDLRNRSQEELLTTTNKVYETNKLIRQAENDIAATTNKRAKQAYEEYINKAKQKQEQNELTQLELDLLTAEYEMTKAQIALEEAQDAKDTVRLTRDSEGNFGYVYTANQDKISDAQQALDDATNNYYNIALDGAKESSEQIYQLQEEWLEKVKEINLDATLDEEQKQAKIAEITEYYDTMISQQRDKFYIAKAAVEESSYAHELDYNLKSISDAEDWFDTKDEIVNNMASAEETYQKRIDEVAEKVEAAYGGEKDALDYVDGATDQYGQDLDNLIPKMETDLTKAIGAATLAWSDYAEQLRDVIKLSDQVIGDTQETLLKETYKDDYQARIDELLAAGYSEDSKEIQLLKKFRAEKIQVTDWYGMAQEAIQKGMSLDDVSWIAKIRDEKTGGNDSYDLIKNYYEKFNHDYFDELQVLISRGYALDSSEVQALIALRDWKLGELGQSATTLKELKDWMKENGIAFASGGYTGDWGPEGKMAILHEKELVLNADDTKNILTSVGIIREISQALDKSALWAALGMGNLSASYIANRGSDTLQQEVTIHADFPNVQDHNEIEMAIDNLINAASQYAYRG